MRQVWAALLLGIAFSHGGPAVSAEPPEGLHLRKGLVAWQTPLRDARRFIEEDVHPNTPHLVTNQKPVGFGCTSGGNGAVTRCIWACCVDLGEPGLVHFATLWFYRDQFYAYDVAFGPGLVASLEKNLTQRFGAPVKRWQETAVNRLGLAFGMGMSTYVVNTERWDPGNTVVLLADRGGQGSPSVAHMYVTYRPLYLQAEPPRPATNPSGGKLPF